MVDMLYRKSTRESSQIVIANNYSDNRCNISTALILKYLERICDHACYIADSVNYIETGMASPRR
jgi:phosphate transport system protein